MTIDTSQLIMIENEENSLCFAPMHAILQSLNQITYSLDVPDMTKGRAIKFLNLVMPIVLNQMAKWGKRVDKNSLKLEIQIERVKSTLHHYHENQVVEAERFLNSLPSDLDEADKAYDRIIKVIKTAIDQWDIFELSQTKR